MGKVFTLGTFDRFALKIGEGAFNGETIVSLMVMGIIVILSFVIYFVFRHLDPTKPEKGFALFIALFFEKIDNMANDLMGKKYDGFGGYIIGLTMYIGLCFLIALTGLPAPLTHLGVTLSIALCTFLLIHGNAARANKLSYFHRYIEPLPFLLPINLLSMWAPLLSLSLRLFGNALSGFTIMGVLYWALGKVSYSIFGGFIGCGLRSVLVAPIITPILHCYFDLFSGLIQTLIFIMLTMINVSLEDPDPNLV